jgi:hypothetical protein
MKNIFKKILIFMILIFSILSINAETESHGLTLTQDITTATIQGVQILILENNVTLTAVNKASSNTATKVYLYDNSYTNLLDTQTFSSNKATFNYNLTANNYYRIYTGKDGSDFDRTIINPATLPINGTYINWTGGASTITIYNNRIFNIESIEIEPIITATTDDFDITILSPYNNTILNYNTTETNLSFKVIGDFDDYNCSINWNNTNYNYTNVLNNTITNKLVTLTTNSTYYWNVTCNNGSEIKTTPIYKFTVDEFSTLKYFVI